MSNSYACASRLWLLDSPTFTYDEGLLLAGASGDVTAPIGAYLIDHPKGLVLFDTHLDPQAVEDPEGAYGPFATAFGLDFPPEKAIDKQVCSTGFSESDVDFLVLSHIHFDHTGGARLFPNAQIILGAEELPFSAWPTGNNQGIFRDADLAPLRDGERSLLEVPVGVDFDMFGDGSVIVLSTPGHTPGHLSVMVRLEHGTFILTADATHTRDAFEREVICPSDVDTVAAVRSMKRLKLLRQSHDALVVIAHDPQDHAEFPLAPAPFDAAALEAVRAGVTSNV